MPLISHHTGAQKRRKITTFPPVHQTFHEKNPKIAITQIEN